MQASLMGWNKSGEQNVASRCQVGAHGALTTAVDAWSMPFRAPAALAWR